MMVDPRLPRSLAIVAGAVTGDSDDRNFPEAGFRADSGGHLVAVHTREANIQQHDVGSEGPGRDDRVGARVGAFGLMSAQLEQVRHATSGVVIVIDDQQAAA